MKSLQTIDRASSVLNLLSHSGAGLKLSYMAEQLGLKSQTLIGILRALQVNGLVIQAAAGGVYMLGPQLQVLHSNWMSNNGDVQIFKLVVDEIHREIQENVVVTSYENDSLQYKYRKVAPHILKVIQADTPSNRMHNLATGKAILAFLPIESQAQKVKSLDFLVTAKNSHRNATSLKKNLKEIRSSKLSILDEESCDGLIAFAVPIFDPRGQVQLSLGSSIPKARLTDALQEKMIRLLKEGATKISQQLYGLSKEYES
ncbi:MAG: IclR family transcriptional regulator [Lentisphaeria bacterium]|nr:IclR family transcriptional regulator [Lentisphaeria bacterium]